jgi:RimJ/RimL family protein N-acetyltransferase
MIIVVAVSLAPCSPPIGCDCARPRPTTRRHGISLLPEARGQGYGAEVIRLLCRYGFRNRNLRRLELETLASNTAMRRTAEACGFTHEGTQRERGCDGDGFADMVI